MLILIGHNDSAYLTTGWHPAQEGPAGVPCRWMSQRAQIRMASAPADHDPPGTSTATITISAPDTIQGREPGLSLYIGDNLLGHCPNLGPEGHWTTATITFAKPAPSDPAKSPPILTLAIENRNAGSPIPLAFIPHETLGNGDLRELGALVSSIRLA